ncbi:DUF4147 domain-containing protein [Planktotalea sp.]|uniref:DUF4147 domain-containing protein n=1 Tax=Planktotalea sp. TaxID=2029877 RepID=UPI003299860A
MHDPTRAMLSSLFQSGVNAVKGEQAVASWLEGNFLGKPTHVLAVGKAALAMFRGLPHDWQITVPSVIVTKTDHLGTAQLGKNVDAVEASHPVPDQASLSAGQKVLDFVKSCNDQAQLLMLVSGGASSLVEHLKEGVAFDELERLNLAALGDGSDIAEINRRRKQISAIKDGLLLEEFQGLNVTTLVISDVCGDGVGVIGSGIGAAPQSPSFDYSSHIVASNALARSAVVQAADEANLEIVSSQENLYDRVSTVADLIAREVQNGPAGIYIYGGEPTVILPENPGQGGRNQALALELAKRFRGASGITGLVAGTDGSDGPTNAAGGFFDCLSFDVAEGADDALQQADSATFLAKTGNQVVTGPTGTNVMDLAIILKQA